MHTGWLHLRAINCSPSKTLAKHSFLSAASKPKRRLMLTLPVRCRLSILAPVHSAHARQCCSLQREKQTSLQIVLNRFQGSDEPHSYQLVLQVYTHSLQEQAPRLASGKARTNLQVRPEAVHILPHVCRCAPEVLLLCDG